jgi:PKD repeat protein
MPATSTDQNPTVTYNTPGVYSVTLKAVNALGESTITETSYITVNTVPTSGFTSTSNMLQVDFTNSTTGATSYSWDFGDGNSSTDTDPVHTYEEDGTYEVVLTATNDCGSVTSTETVVVVSMPTAGFTADATNGCAPMTVQFSNNSSQNAETFEWSFPGGDPATSTEENPTVVYNTPGVFGVTLTVTNAAGSNTSNEVDFVTVNAAPATSFDHSISGNDVTFENTSDNFTSYSWDFGDGNTSDENNPTHTYESDGAYTVVLTTTNECGSTTFETVVVIATEGPIAAFTAMAEEGCAPFVVEFENLSSQNAETFEWTFEGGDPATSNEENPTVTYNAPGVYSVTLTVTNANGSDTSTEMDYIIVNDVPTPDFTSDANWQEISFTNTSTNGTTYSWDFGDGNTSTEADPTHTYEQEGEYEVTLTATNDCGFNTITQTVIVMANSTTEIPGISEFNIWPNPNNGRFSMTLQGEPLGNLDVYFTNVLGQVLLNEKIDFRSGSITKEFVFDDLAAGVYIFQLRSGNKSIHRKVVVD